MDFRYWVVQVNTKYEIEYFPFLTVFFSECEACNKPGHTCDVDTGRCVCPQLTEGQECSQCTTNAFGWVAYKGCQVGIEKVIKLYILVISLKYSL